MDIDDGKESSAGGDNPPDSSSDREGPTSVHSTTEDSPISLVNSSEPSPPPPQEFEEAPDSPPIQRASDQDQSDLVFSAPRYRFRRRLTLFDVSTESHRSSESDPEWLNLETCSNSSFSDASDAMDEDDNESKEMPRVLLKEKPKHKWFAVREIMHREVQGGKLFREKYYGSLHVVQRLELMYKMDEHAGCVNAINFDATGSRLISGSDDRSVCIWDWPRGQLMCKFPTGHASNVFQCKYLGLGHDRIVTCSRDGQVRMAETNGSSWETSQLANHSQPCHKLTTLPTSQDVFLTAGEDALILSIDVRQPKASKLMYVKEKSQKVSLYSIHANPLTGHQFCVAGEDCFVRIYDRRNLSKDGQTPWKLSPPHIKNSAMCYVTCAVFNYNGTQVIGSYNDDDIYLFEGWESQYQPLVPQHQYEGHRNSQTVKGVNFFGPKSEFVISGSDCGNIYIWDKETEAIVQFMRGDEDGVINCLEPHPHIPILATSGLDSDVKIWIPSCEHEPLMKGLKKTLNMNHLNRDMKFDMSTSSRNELVLNLWSQMRTTGLSQLLLTHHPASSLLFSQTSSSYSDSDSQSDGSDEPQL